MRWLSKWLLVYVVLYMAGDASATLQRRRKQHFQVGRNIVKVSFERTGGFAGLRLRTTIDTNTLPPEQAAELQKLVDAAGFFTLPKKLTAKTPGGDRFQYTITVETQTQHHTVTIEEGAAPSSVRPLLNWLTTTAKTKTP
jgi:hypothetical protein